MTNASQTITAQALHGARSVVGSVVGSSPLPVERGRPAAGIDSTSTRRTDTANAVARACAGASGPEVKRDELWLARTPGNCPKCGLVLSVKAVCC